MLKQRIANKINFSDDKLEGMKILDYRIGRKAVVAGSSGIKDFSLYASDIDMLDKVKLKPGQFVKFLRNIIKKINGLKNWYFIELKAGNIHWTSKLILNKITTKLLEEALTKQPYAKIDVLFFDGKYFEEITMLFQFVESPLEQYKEDLEKDIKHYEEENFYYKMCKRLLSLAKLNNETETIKKLESILIEPFIGTLYKSYGRLEAIERLELVKKKIPNKTQVIKSVIQNIKEDISTLSFVDNSILNALNNENLEYAKNELFKLINKMTLELLSGKKLIGKGFFGDIATALEKYTPSFGVKKDTIPPDILFYAKIYAPVYQSSTNRPYDIMGYKYMQSLSTEYMSVYHKDNEYVISARGTKVEDAEDLLSDIKIVSGSFEDDERYKTFSDRVIKIITTDPSVNKIVLIGHSLGGMSVYMAMKNAEIIKLTNEKGIKLIGIILNGATGIQNITSREKFEIPNLSYHNIEGDVISATQGLSGSQNVFIYPKQKPSINPHSLDQFVGGGIKTPMEVQSILFDRSDWNKDAVYKWLLKNKKKLIKPLDITDHFYRARQEYPKTFDSKSFRIKKLKDGINLILGKRKK